MKIRWRFGIIAGIVLTMFSLFPQTKLIYNRGSELNGHIAFNDVDEAAYAAYLNALIDGRPRKNDPFTGRDEATGDPKAESVFSIQFVAPYVIAIPARFFGLNADRAMIILGALAAFVTGLAIFWIVVMMTRDELFAMSASLATVCFGTLAAGEGAVREILFGEISYPFFPGFRRYVPAVAFPVFFVFCGLLWKLTAAGSGGRSADLTTNSKTTVALPILAAICFGFTVFSYFYLWTAAAAFLFSLTVLIAIARPVRWPDSVFKLLCAGFGCLVLLLPYGLLLSNRESSIDSFQMAVKSRGLDLFRFPELVAILAAILILAAFLTPKRTSLKDPVVIFTLALVFSVFAMFNQQVVTGTSLQPIHYQVFVGNYVAALALLLAGWALARSVGLLTGRFWGAATLIIAGGAVIWGALECQLNSSVLDETNIRLDASMPLAKKLRALAAGDHDDKDATVLAYDLLIADKLPGVTPQNVLWARHQAVFSSLTREESERRFFCYLYYLNVDVIRLDRLLRSDHVTITALFGWDRHTDRLSVDASPVTDAEIRVTVSRYEIFRQNFDARDASEPRLSFAVVPEGEMVDLANLRKWYDLEEIANSGGSVLYRTRLHG